MYNTTYKAKSIKDRSWLEGYYCRKEIDGETRHFIYCNNKEHRVDPKTLCLYTQKKDEKGNKIFTADIVKIDETGKEYEVVWNGRKCRFSLVSRTLKTELSLGHKQIEVLTNVYDRYADLF